MYPKVGDLIEATIHQKRRDKIVIGRICPSNKNPRKPAVFARYGYIGCYVETRSGKVAVPWTSDESIVEFQILEEVC